jgi:hypothetical protein
MIRELIKQKEIKIIMVITGVMTLCLLIGMAVYPLIKEKNPPTTLKRLAYDVAPSYGYTIYLEEESGYHPYLVLTDDYDGGGDVLLLRQYVLDEYQPLYKERAGIAYYGKSYLDEYLNNEYYETLSERVQEKVVESPVEIFAKTAWGHNGKDVPMTIHINRKVFVLSVAEVTPRSTRRSIREGRALKYFKDDVERTRAFNAEGKSVFWRLRTPAFDTVTGVVIGPDLLVDLGNIYNPLGVWPALCMPGNVKIKQSETVIEGQTVYVLEE